MYNELWEGIRKRRMLKQNSFHLFKNSNFKYRPPNNKYIVTPEKKYRFSGLFKRKK